MSSRIQKIVMIRIEGYSDCGIDPVRDPVTNEWLLEKSTNKPDYVPRLRKQKDKQVAFCHSNQLRHVFVPQVRYTREETLAVEGGRSTSVRYVFALPFVHHVDAITFLSRASMVEVDGLANTLFDLVDQSLAASPVKSVDPSIVLRKLDEIAKLTGSNQHVDATIRSAVVDDMIVSLKAYVERVGLHIPVGTCHGDLTLSNVLVLPQHPMTADRVHIALIDFLDSFVESPLADLAKLCQDLKYAWTIRRVNDVMEGDVLSLILVLQRMYNFLMKRYASAKWFKQYFTLFFIMNQLRVLQYSKDKVVANYLYETAAAEYSIFKSELEGKSEL